MSALTDFTEADEAISPVLGPEHGASRRLSEAMLDKFDCEHLRPLIDKAADEFRDKLWGDVTDWLLQDAELNVAGAVRSMVEQTVVALLTGKQWAMDRYPFADYAKGEDIRRAVAGHGSDRLLMARISDLEAELSKANQTIDWLRR